MKEYKDLLKRQKEDRDKLKTELKVLKIIKDKFKDIDVKIYIHDLYGVKIDLKFYDEFRSIGANKDQINKLLKYFKPIPCFLSGGNSFRPTIDEQKENIPINPYFMRYDGFDGDFFINWFSKIENDLIEVKVKTTNEIRREILEVKYDTKLYPGGRRVENFYSHILGNFDDGNYKKITWARGSEKYPNDVTIYSQNLETDFKDYLNT